MKREQSNLPTLPLLAASYLAAVVESDLDLVYQSFKVVGKDTSEKTRFPGEIIWIKDPSVMAPSRSNSSVSGSTSGRQARSGGFGWRKIDY